MCLFARHAAEDLRAAATIDLGYLGDEVVAARTDDPRSSDGLALGERFAEPAADGDVITAAEVVRPRPSR